MARALVTGATGLVGSYIVERLLADGWAVRTMSRSAASAARRGERVEAVDGNVLDGTAFSRAAAGCDVIFHAAAAVSARGGWEEYRTTNIDGTRNAVEAAGASGARLVQVSSVAVYGADERYRDGRRTDEDAPLPPLPEGAWYARSKRESEAVALDAHRAGRIWATAIRPNVIYGRGDRQFTPRVARMLRFGIAPVPNGGHTTLPVVHAANVADAAVRAATTDIAGGRAYNTANDFEVTLAQFLGLAGIGLGRTIRLVNVPLWLLEAGLALGLRARPLFARVSAPLSSRASIDFLSRDNPFTSDRARVELGWNPQTRPEIGVPEAFRWWKEHRR